MTKDTNIHMHNIFKVINMLYVLFKLYRAGIVTNCTPILE